MDVLSTWAERMAQNILITEGIFEARFAENVKIRLITCDNRQRICLTWCIATSSLGNIISICVMLVLVVAMAAHRPSTTSYLGPEASLQESTKRIVCTYMLRSTTYQI